MRYACAVVVLFGVGFLGGCDEEGGEWNHGGSIVPPALSGVDGSNCDGTYYCPDGQIAVLEGPVGADACVCRFPCDAPDGPCPIGERVCIPLEDDAGNPMPGVGACEPISIAAVGEPCGPQQCDSGLICAGYTADTAYCRRTCELDTDDCGVGYACTAVDDGTATVAACLPVTGDVADGGACGADAACEPGLFCAGTRAGFACRTACDPWAPVCPEGTDCLRVEDPVMETLGYACLAQP